MALSAAKKPLFSDEWAEGLRASVESGMIASVHLFEPGGEGVWDPSINDWTEPLPVTLYEGKARVQPIRTASDRTVPGNATTVQTVLVSVPREATALDIRPGQQLRVTGAGMNPQLTEFQYVVHEVLDSSNPLEKTFYCKVNQEVKV